jgi:capsular exopolysaccharide synthesis family protein
VEVPRYRGTVGESKSAVQGKYVMYGFVIGFLLALIRFVFFFKLKNIREVKTWSNIPILGSMRYIKGEMDIRSPDFLKSEVANILRSIRASLKFIDSNQKVILVTSMFPSEGKSLNSIMQGAIQASSGKKTILIDFDLHKPSVHKKLDLKNDKGMTNFLSGQTDDVMSLCNEVSENYFVMTSGQRPPNPSELVLSDRTSFLFETLHENFDQIIVDTPPLHLITDAKILQAYADINIVVLNVKNATRKTLLDIEEYKERFEPKNMCVLLNGVRETKLSYLYSYKYKYAYKYGYGYAGYKYSYNYGQEKK